MPRTRIRQVLTFLVLCAGGTPLLAGTDNGGNLQAQTPSATSSTTSTSAQAPTTVGNNSVTKLPFTVTATLREEYDDNIFTAKTNTVASFKTVLSPSILFDLPMENSDLSLRYTFGMTYFENRQGDPIDYSHEFVATYKHDFSERFSLSLAEQFRYSTEPSLMDNVGTLFRNGAYIANTVNGAFTAQWTPLVSTSTTYANNIIRYEDATQSIEQDNVENTASQSIGFAILPKVNLVFGGIIDDISYDHIARGYTSYTGNTGVDWRALPSLSMGARVGGTYTDTQQAGTSASPYFAANLAWQLGARSSLSFNYSHDVVPTDVNVAAGQVADRVSSTFRYDFTSRLSGHFGFNYTHGEYTQGLITPGTVSSFSENDLALDLGGGFHLNSNFDLEAGYLFSDVSSDLNFRDYIRDQIYLGVRGTY